jgi:flavin-dependent dehydrogenase
VSVNGLGQENASPGAFPAEADAVVCGGGPGGSTFATLMARMGYRTVVLEREKFPRFHIGESLLPWNVPL